MFPMLKAALKSRLLAKFDFALYSTQIEVLPTFKIRDIDCKRKAEDVKKFHLENHSLFGPLIKNKKAIANDKCAKNQAKPGLESNDDDVISFPLNNTLQEKLELNTGLKYPSVSAILNRTMSDSSRYALEKWKQGFIEELGEEGFEEYQQTLFRNGKELHQSIQDVLSGQIPEIKPEIQNYWKSLENVFPSIVKVSLIEAPVQHPKLKYHGIVDCVAVYRNQLVVIDWKTSKKLKPSLSKLFDNPIQVAAYAGALNYDPRYKLEINSAAVIVAYEDGSPSNVHYLNPLITKKYWQKWLIRLKYFNELVNKQNCIEIK